MLSLFPIPIVASFVLLYFFHIREGESDFSCYQKLVQESQDLREKGVFEKSLVCQKRKGASKDIWTNWEGQRIHSHVTSGYSELVLTQKKEKMEGIERLQHLEGWFAFEGKPYHLRAESGLCVFPSCKIEMEGPFLSGEENTHTHMRAQRAYFNPDEGLFCTAPRGEYMGNQFEAEKGRMLLKPHTFFLDGNVKLAFFLQDKQSFAIADSSIFYMDGKKMLLESVFPNRVLFQQQDLEISAPTVKIEQAIQGIGDVRFFFSPDEKAILTPFKQILKKNFPKALSGQAFQ